MEPTQTDVKEYKYFAGNEWRKAADGKVFDVHEPYTGKLFVRVAAGGAYCACVARARGVDIILAETFGENQTRFQIVYQVPKLPSGASTKG